MVSTLDGPCAGTDVSPADDTKLPPGLTDS